MLKVSNLKVKLGEIIILKDISLDLKKGEKIGIIGPNGHGKTTTMKTILGIFDPLDGQILFNDDKINGLDSGEIVEKGITLVPEGGHLFPEMTVKENLLLGAYNSRANKKKNEMLELVYDIFPKLKKISGQLCNTLSGGENRMVSVGRGLMSSPEILILDEPTLGLAPNLVEDMKNKLIKINKRLGISMILTDENMDLIEEFSDRVYFLENGEIKIEGSPKEVLTNKYVKETFLGLE